MAASITTAGTTLEQQALEVATALQTLESAADPVLNRVQITPNIEARTVQLSINLPIEYAYGASGLSLTAAEYLA